MPSQVQHFWGIVKVWTTEINCWQHRTHYFVNVPVAQLPSLSRDGCSAVHGLAHLHSLNLALRGWHRMPSCATCCSLYLAVGGVRLPIKLCVTTKPCYGSRDVLWDALEGLMDTYGDGPSAVNDRVLREVKADVKTAMCRRGLKASGTSW